MQSSVVAPPVSGKSIPAVVPETVVFSGVKNDVAAQGKHTAEDAGLSSPKPRELTESEAVAVWQNEGDPN